ncbi:DNA binding domain, excisionase family [Acididesulfobacillus acetoxydans]|uniref:DNA binding domain, excisionase n=1 Tax=Acididesulfobacillus acetoxydans TaxID=1561005 RepID=A0A8S0VVH0_9FIRM|nr:helix-turn-helix transcriptional regulator [Acididesulfobacillus acetoxydans]CAA7599463.1 DNA binding domain, excisionase family [Acididesulfobacillus acetoxydans]CEJ06732.1 DNA binding domain, excisionase [Acididesulfobacillus acetoxydans]
MAEDVSYTPEEVAKILKISKFTVYELIKRGQLVAYHIGRKVRVEAADLEAYKKKAKGVVVHAPFSSSSPGGENRNRPFPESAGLVICGQDVILDILTRHLEKRLPHLSFLRQYIGSIDGLTALYRGQANAVTAHLWDSDTDEYNIPYVRHMLPGHRALVINLVYRTEGFYVAGGNPQNILTWQDLTRPGVRFVNRERGSGARVLLDGKLKVLAIDRRQIRGYGDEEMSHLAVASRVARGEADAGLGIEKAALQVSGLDFVPLQKERYDLIILQEDLDKPPFQALLSILNSPAFQNEVRGIGGYDVSRMGEIIKEV